METLEKERIVPAFIEELGICRDENAQQKMSQQFSRPAVKAGVEQQHHFKTYYCGAMRKVRS